MYRDREHFEEELEKAVNILEEKLEKVDPVDAQIHYHDGNIESSNSRTHAHAKLLLQGYTPTNKDNTFFRHTYHPLKTAEIKYKGDKKSDSRRKGDKA